MNSNRNHNANVFALRGVDEMTVEEIAVEEHFLAELLDTTPVEALLDEGEEARLEALLNMTPVVYDYSVEAEMMMLDAFLDAMPEE